jgi:RimJ/RimL family protein N-acetyltransferase
MTAAPAFDPQVVLAGPSVRLRPLREEDLAPLWRMVCDEEGRRLTGTHARFTREAVDRWYRTRGIASDRLDLAIATLDDDRCIGEMALTELDADNRSCGSRISLVGPDVYGRGFGTEATRLVLAHAFTTVGLHRVELQVYRHNPRAKHVYERVGFVEEGTLREALLWGGEFLDATIMSILAHEWARRD